MRAAQAIMMMVPRAADGDTEQIFMLYAQV